MAPHGRFVWHELNTRNIEKNRDHYAAAYGWEWDAQPMPEGMYYVAKQGEEMVAGMFDITGIDGMDGVPDHWLIYMSVADVDATVAKLQSAGGGVIRPPFDVPGIGRFAIVQDAGGAAFGLMQDAS
ncbi:VOC family protein [Roseobacteraceae bacterium S113]